MAEFDLHHEDVTIGPATLSIIERNHNSYTAEGEVAGVVQRVILSEPAARSKGRVGVEGGQVWLTQPLDDEYDERTEVVKILVASAGSDDLVGKVLESWRDGVAGETVAVDRRTLVGRLRHREGA